MTARVTEIKGILNGYSAESIAQCLDRVKTMEGLSDEEMIDLARLLSEVFYLAHHTGATAVPKLAVRVEKRLARFGPLLIPFLYAELLEADGESAVYFGKTLSRIGPPALDRLIQGLDDSLDERGTITNIIQALACFKIAETIKALPLLLESVDGPNHQVTAMALYAAGQWIQKLPAAVFKDELRSTLFEKVFTFFSHHEGLVRKNAVRAMGKMVKRGFLNDDQVKKISAALLAITGNDEKHNWDRSYIVRREAENYLRLFKGTRTATSRYVQSFRILTKKKLCSNTYHYTLEAPLIAQKIEAGQFIIIRPHILSERIPISVCGWDRAKGSISIIISTAGRTTAEINDLSEGEALKDVVGPLGERSKTPAVTGTCIVVGGGYGAGAIIPAARELRSAGNRVIGIVGARTRDNLIMTDELRDVCHDLVITTNDGSAGLGGMVTDALRELLHKEDVIYVLAVGPVPMMKAVSDLTRPRNIPTYVSLNAIMVDGTGMCGACRVTVGGQSRFACFHGPEFDGHLVDFENLIKRQKMYLVEERIATNRLHG